MVDPSPIETPLFERLRALDIDYALFRHPPLFTVDESKALRGDIAGLHVKNLLVRDKKRTLWLVVVPEDKAVDLKGLRQQLDTRGALSFASAELLHSSLGVEPGSVTPLAVLNDPHQRVSLVLDSAAVRAPTVCCHPLHNAATVAMSGGQLLHFVQAVHGPPTIVDVASR